MWSCGPPSILFLGIGWGTPDRCQGQARSRQKLSLAESQMLGFLQSDPLLT